MYVLNCLNGSHTDHDANRLTNPFDKRVKRLEYTQPYATHLIKGYRCQPVYDPNPFQFNPNSLTFCRVCVRLMGLIKSFMH